MSSTLHLRSCPPPATLRGQWCHPRGREASRSPSLRGPGRRRKVGSSTPCRSGSQRASRRSPRAVRLRPDCCSASCCSFPLATPAHRCTGMPSLPCVWVIQWQPIGAAPRQQLPCVSPARGRTTGRGGIVTRQAPPARASGATPRVASPAAAARQSPPHGRWSARNRAWTRAESCRSGR